MRGWPELKESRPKVELNSWRGFSLSLTVVNKRMYILVSLTEGCEGMNSFFSYQPVRVKSEEIRDTSGIILVWEGMFKRHRLYHSPLIRLWQIRRHKTYGTLTHTPVINGHLRATIINDVSVNKLNRQTFKRSHSFKIRAQMKDGGVCTFFSPS